MFVIVHVGGTRPPGVRPSVPGQYHSARATRLPLRPANPFETPVALATAAVAAPAAMIAACPRIIRLLKSTRALNLLRPRPKTVCLGRVEKELYPTVKKEQKQPRLTLRENKNILHGIRAGVRRERANVQGLKS